MEGKSKLAGFKAVPNGEEKCIWMEAGVIDYKLCNYYYNCHTCPFDKAMKQAADKNAAARLQGLELSGKKAHITSWQEKMKKRPGLQRECRHTLTGRTTFRLCPYEYECNTCELGREAGQDVRHLAVKLHLLLETVKRCGRKDQPFPYGADGTPQAVRQRVRV